MFRLLYNWLTLDLLRLGGEQAWRERYLSRHHQREYRR